MGYYECSFNVSVDQREAVIAFCCRLGCLGITERDDSLIGYFPDTVGIDRIRSEITSFQFTIEKCGLSPLLNWECTYLAERDWNETWKKRFVPIKVGERLRIIPPWETSARDRIPLIIDPGMAFGTGHHETTKNCLEYVERISLGNWPHGEKQKNNRHLRFLDVGTGTGILAIAAAKLGFRYVVGVDIDPLAVDASTRNVAINNTADVITIREGTIQNVEGVFDVIAANLMSEVLIGIAHEVVKHLAPTGILLTSGMIAGQEDEVIQTMTRAGLKPIDSTKDGRWVSVVFIPA